MRALYFAHWAFAAELGDASCATWAKISRAEDFFFTDEEKALRQKQAEEKEAVRQQLAEEADEYVKSLDYAMPGDGIGAVKWIWYPEIFI